MSKRILLEDSFGRFSPARDDKGAIKATILESSVVKGRSITRIPGRFSQCDETNGNNRRYGRQIWEKNLKEGSTLKTLIGENAAFGLLEHPADGHIDLTSPIAVSVSDAQLQENGEVTGEITILNTPEGHKLLALIESGWDPRVSSRGFGSLVRGPDGVDEVQDDFVCEGWDVVLKPSFKSAVLEPERGDEITRTESLKPKTPSFDYKIDESSPSQAPPAKSFAEQIAGISSRAAAKKVMNEGIATLSGRDASVESAILESTADDALKGDMAYHYSRAVVKGTWNEGLPFMRKSKAWPTYKHLLDESKTISHKSVTPAAKGTNKPIKESVETPMNAIESVKQRIDALKRAANGESLCPKDFASAMQEANALHENVAGFLSEDASRSWQATQMHTEIQEAEKALESKILESSVSANKLLTDKNKLLKVLEAVTQQAVELKKKLGEAINKRSEREKVVQEVAKRGRYWKARAERMESRALVSEGRCDIAYRVADYVSERYKQDTTRLSANQFLQEFAEELATDEHAATKMTLESVANGKAPKSITCLRDLVPLRESLAATGENLSEGAKPKSAKKPLTEGTPAGAGKKPDELEGQGGVIAEGEKRTNIRILDHGARKPMDVNESASIARRLSESVN